jgi:hypothetical protein
MTKSKSHLPAAPLDVRTALPAANLAEDVRRALLLSKVTQHRVTLPVTSRIHAPGWQIRKRG